MLIYAKQRFSASPRRLARDLRSRVAARPWPDLADSREWLIATGQLEQAVLDAGGEGNEISAATIAAADLFLATRSSTSGGARVKSCTERLALALHRIEATSQDREIDVRVPEGFAWYALYPDSYAQTAETWSRRCEAAKSDICVIGLRSIGTTLAAVVAQALRNCGRTVRSCISLRPSGDPFSRSAELPAGFVPGSQNIIVDEGPGLSGSSMVAVARALHGVGADAAGIYFFAGHANGPGRAADESIRGWWRAPRVWTTELDDTVVDGSVMPDVLSSLIETCSGEIAEGPAKDLDMLGWISLAGLSALPRAVAPGLETPKKIVHLRSGRAVLLKFTGFALTSAAHRLEHRKSPRTAIAPFGSGHGWTAMPWVEGRRLTVADGGVPFQIDHLGPWIVAAASETLMADEIRDGIGRIASALKAWAMTRDGAARVRGIELVAEREAMNVSSATMPCYGDGRLAPHEWIRTLGGAILKADAGGHHCDHTWVGRQPIAWDLAGAEIEWELDDRRAATLYRTVQQTTGIEHCQATRPFYKAGYCVFRAAAAYHSASVSSDAEVCHHLRAAGEWYERRLEAELATLTEELAPH